VKDIDTNIELYRSLILPICLWLLIQLLAVLFLGLRLIIFRGRSVFLGWTPTGI